MFGILVVASALLVVCAQHSEDPFAGSGCDCDRFCRYECAINASKPVTTTVYRMTMHDVYDLRDKNTGDAAGDTSFVIAKKNNAFDCRQEPDSFMCKGFAQFSGDDANSTDVILEMRVQVDGQWGPYLECNPINASKPTGLWSCENGIKFPPPAGFPDVCKKMHYSAYTGYCDYDTPAQRYEGFTLAQCCSASDKTANVQGYNYFPANQTCLLFSEINFGSFSMCEPDAIVAHYDPPDPNKCECERMYKAVGRQNQTAHKSSFSIAGGLWYSHPSAGLCTGDQTPGDASGCTYRVLDVPRAINATCMYKTIDKAIESANPECFRQCPQPHNVTSTCYLGCFKNTTEGLTDEQLVQPWKDAFAPSGCPQVPIASHIHVGL